MQVASYLVGLEEAINRLSLVFAGVGGGKRKVSESPEGLYQGDMESRVMEEGSIRVGSRGGKNSVSSILVTPSCCCP